jgi:hypothetical protein
MSYEKPRLVDFGSIRDHTFSRCNPLGALANNGGNTPPKASDDVPHHMDNHMECSGLS